MHWICKFLYDSYRQLMTVNGSNRQLMVIFPISWLKKKSDNAFRICKIVHIMFINPQQILRT